MTTGVINSALGRMFARQNLPDLYTKQKLSSDDQPANKANLPIADNVSLSSFTPRPLPVSYFSDAVKSSDSLLSGKVLDSSSQDRIREDRVYAALSTLIALGGSEGANLSWPGGLPVPNKEELAVAYRRLSQRLVNDQDVSKTQLEGFQAARIELVEKFRGKDLSTLNIA